MNRSENFFKYLPYEELLTDEQLSSLDESFFKKYSQSIVSNKDGSVQVTFQINASGVNLQGVEMDRRAAILSEFISQIGDNIVLFYDVVRIKKCEEYLCPNIKIEGTVGRIEKERKEIFENSLYVNNLYATLIYKTPSANIGISTVLLEDFLRLLDRFCDYVKRCDCSAEILKAENLFSYLHYCMSGQVGKVLKPSIPENLSNYFCNNNYQFDTIPLVTSFGNVKKYIQCISTTGLPENTIGDFLSPILSVKGEFRICVKYFSYSQKKAIERINKRRKQYYSNLFSFTQVVKKEAGIGNSEEADSLSVLGKEECTRAIYNISENGLSAGDFTLSFIVFGKTEEETGSICQELLECLSRMGILCKKEILGNFLAFQNSIVGSPIMFRSSFVLSNNVADILHLSMYSSGSYESKLLINRTGSNAPLLYCKNLDGTPYYFSLSGKDGQKGHTFVTGSTGSGKSVFLSLLATSYLKYGNTRVIFIDKDSSSLNVALSNNGKIYMPGLDKTSLSPFKNSKKRRDSIMNFLRLIAISNNIEFEGRVRKSCSTALELLPKEDESFSSFYAILKGIDVDCPLLAALSQYINGGVYGKIYDSENDGFDTLGRITLIETGFLIKSGSRSDDAMFLPALIYIFSRLDEFFMDAVPTLLILDEAWKYLKDNFIVEYFENWLKTLRKKNVDVVFSITDLEDISKSNIVGTIVGNVETKVFFPDRSSKDDYVSGCYKKFGLTNAEIDLLGVAPQFHPLIKNDCGTALVSLAVYNQLEYLESDNDMKRKYYEKIAP